MDKENTMNGKKIEINHPQTWGTWTVGDELLDGVFAITEDARDFYGTVTVKADGRLVVHSNALNILTDGVTVVEPAPAPTLPVGTVLVSSWGYDQTNVDFYEVVGVTPSGKSVRIRPIASEHVATTGFMAERVRPVPGEFTGPPVTKRIKRRGDHVYLALTSYSNAYPATESTYTATHYA